MTLVSIAAVNKFYILRYYGVTSCHQLPYIALLLLFALSFSVFLGYPSLLNLQKTV